MKYVQKPRTIEAHLWNGYDGVFEIVEAMVVPYPVDRQSNDSLGIHTPRGTQVAQFGDYVCKDAIDGAVFVMKPEGFKLLYVEADEEEA